MAATAAAAAARLRVSGQRDTVTASGPPGSAARAAAVLRSDRVPGRAAVRLTGCHSGLASLSELGLESPAATAVTASAAAAPGPGREQPGRATVIQVQVGRSSGILTPCHYSICHAYRCIYVF